MSVRAALPALAPSDAGRGRRFVSEVRLQVNVAPLPEGPPVPELAALGLARLSWGPLLHWDVMAHFKEKLATLRQ